VPSNPTSLPQPRGYANTNQGEGKPSSQTPDPEQKQQNPATARAPADAAVDRRPGGDDTLRTKPLVRPSGSLPWVAAGPPASAAESTPAAKSPTPEKTAVKTPGLFAGCSGAVGGAVYGISSPQNATVVPREIYIEGIGPVDSRLRLWVSIYASGRRSSYLYRMVPNASGAWAFPLGLGNPDGDWGAEYTIAYHVMTREQEIQAGLQAGTDRELEMTHWSSVPGALCPLVVKRESSEAARAAALISPFKR
jgi:hypothetical protein